MSRAGGVVNGGERRGVPWRSPRVRVRRDASGVDEKVIGLAFYARHGITVQRVMTDIGSASATQPPTPPRQDGSADGLNEPLASAA